MRFWLGLAGFVVLVGVLAFIGLSRAEERPSLDGRWDLVVVETPEGAFEPEGPEWIEFDASHFSGQMVCVDFEGDFSTSGNGGIALDSLGWSSQCNELEGTGYAFETYFSEVSEIRFDPDLSMQNWDGSVRFVFTREEPS